MYPALNNEAAPAVYPGNYIPGVDRETLKNQIRQLGIHQVSHPALIFRETADSFQIEVQIPGVNREVILVEVDDHILQIYAARTLPFKRGEKFAILPRDNEEYFERHIPLPEQADVTFSKCTYQAGVLQIEIAKSKTPAEPASAWLAVY